MAPMSPRTFVRTTCNRDCPDACGIIAEVDSGRIVALRGDPDHPVTQGFLCFRTSRFLQRHYHPSRLSKPLLRRGDRQVEIPLAEALDLAAEKLASIKAESGPGAILHYRSGGSLGMLKMMADHFFNAFGPVAAKAGDICSGGGDAAQEMDFNHEDSNDVFDLYNSKHIINWGKNLYVSNVHLIPIVKEARARGAKLYCIDPVRTRSAELADHYMSIKPDTDISLAMAVARRLFERGAVDETSARARCDYFDEYRAFAFSSSIAEWSAACEVSEAQIELLANAFADGPTAVLVGWGMQRTVLGASNVRALDALSAISGNLSVKGGGVSFYYKRRSAFDVSWMKSVKPPRVFLEPLLGEQLLAADPPVRALWVTAGNPVAMLPDSATVARAIESIEFSVVVDSFPTDTTRRATLVLPTTTMLEDDDLLGAYGHHYLGISRPVVPPPPEVLTDLQILQELGKRLGMSEELEGSARAWKKKMLAQVADRGASLEDLESKGTVKNPLAKAIVFDEPKVPTASGRVQLIHRLPAVPKDSDEDRERYPLVLLSNSSEKSQSSQWAIENEGAITATMHPDAARGIADGARARLRSALGALVVRVVHDPMQRKDVVVVPKGGHFDRGWAVNAIIRARETDHGGGAAYLSTRVQIEPLSNS